MNTLVYDAQTCVVEIDGRIMTDYGDGDFASWSKDEANFEAKTSANGTVGVAINHSRIGTFTYRPMQGSQEITFLKNLANTRKMFTVALNSGGDYPEIISGTKAMVEKTPDGALGKEISDREFTIKVFDYTDE